MYKKAVLALVQERLKFLSELPELTEFFFTVPSHEDGLLQTEATSERYNSPTFSECLTKAHQILESSDFSLEDLEARLRGLAETMSIKPGTLFSAIRIAITGKKAAPGIFETLHVIGKKSSLERLDLASKR